MEQINEPGMHIIKFKVKKSQLNEEDQLIPFAEGKKMLMDTIGIDEKTAEFLAPYQKIRQIYKKEEKK
jgi:hypothetical protein